jgi:hypothetical protein
VSGIDDRLRATLGSLADDMAGDAGSVRPDDVRAAFTRRRRARLAVVGVTAAVALVGGLPLGVGWLSSSPAPTEGAGPRTSSAEATPAPTVLPSTTPAVTPGPADLPGRYADLLAVHSCLVDQGFDPDPPVGEDAFVAAGGTDWSPYDGLADREVADAAAACPLPESR